MWKQVQDALNQSTTAFITKLARLLPGFVALILALLISLALAWIVAMVVRRLLSSIRFDELLAHWGLPLAAESSPGRSPTLLVSGAIGVAVIAAGLLIGVAAFDSELTSELVRNVFAYVPNIVGAILVLLVGTIAARFLARSVLIGAVNLNLGYARLLSAARGEGPGQCARGCHGARTPQDSGRHRRVGVRYPLRRNCARSGSCCWPWFKRPGHKIAGA